MSTKKHLVLDDDVHEALEQRKGLTGSSIKDIGNDVLRSSLESVFLGDIIGRILVESGKVSENEYGQALEQAFTKIKTTPNLPVERTLKGTLVAGSWESRQLFQRSDGSFQILESWTRDSPPTCCRGVFCCIGWKNNRNHERNTIHLETLKYAASTRWCYSQCGAIGR